MLYDAASVLIVVSIKMRTNFSRIRADSEIVRNWWMFVLRAMKDRVHDEKTMSTTRDCVLEPSTKSWKSQSEFGRKPRQISEENGK